MTSKEELYDIVKEMASRVADGPVTMEVDESLKAVTFTFSAAPADVGRLIGKGGDMIDSLDLIAARMGSRIGTGKLVVANVEKTSERVREILKYEPNRYYDPLAESDLLARILRFIFDGDVRVWSEKNDTDRTALAAMVPKQDLVLRDALQTVFMAIGRRRGQKLTVKFITE